MSVKVNITTTYSPPNTNPSPLNDKQRSAGGDKEEAVPMIGGSLKNLAKKIHQKEMMQVADDRHQVPVGQKGAVTKVPADPSEFKYRHEITVNKETSLSQQSKLGQTSAQISPLSKPDIKTDDPKPAGNLLPPLEPKPEPEANKHPAIDKNWAAEQKPKEQPREIPAESKLLAQADAEETRQQEALSKAPNFMLLDDKARAATQEQEQLVNNDRRQQIFGSLKASDDLKGVAIGKADQNKSEKKDLVGEYVGQLHRTAKARAGMLDDLAEKINSLQHKIDEKTIMEKAAEARLSNSRTTMRASRARATDELPAAIPAPKINYQTQQSTTPELHPQQATPFPSAPKVEDVPSLPSVEPDNQPVEPAAVDTFDNKSTDQKIGEFSAELKKALKGLDVSGTNIKLSSSDGSQPINKLQTEGVFGISSSGRHLGVRDFIRDKQFEYQLDHKPLTLDSFFKETENAIYNVLNSPESSGVSKPLIKVAEAINSYRNNKLKSTDAQ